ncbi:hypothetical protein STCU_03547 [Strigomonas culicis]|uniref:SET domain-containing protein n=1 Tax=Strigomonas culicis TaxID=28005 RepID=S9UK99_9TRYP|nr:hypothetical protein STCU_03547 [Strigomonas culicis]|eukprot:EPY31252.1 hypothetical protein STCU_03547 [Strigomonas culicis]
MDPTHVDNFWSYCGGVGVVSKKLALHRNADTLSLMAGEPIKRGSPIISVPYTSVLNCQTVRGDCLPRGLPPATKMVRFLTRRHRMDFITAHSLWLASFVALSRCPWGTPSKFAPLFVDSLTPKPPYTSRPQVMEDHLHLIDAVLQFFFQRNRIPRKRLPSLELLSNSCEIVRQRSLILPLNGAPSAPDTLSDFLSTDTSLRVLPSLVPAIDLVRPSPNSDESRDNCELYTCVASEFVSPSTRRRLVLQVAPFASRRVVLCALKDLKEGDELFMGLEHEASQ